MKPKIRRTISQIILFCVLVSLPGGMLAQNIVTGKITNVNDESLPMVSVFIKGSTIGVISDLEGNYKISVPESATNTILVFSQIGMKTLEESLGNRTVVNVQLKDDISELSEVVVTALGIKREEKALGYSVQKIGGDELSVVKGVDLVSNLNGKVAGMKIANTTEISEKPKIELRGSAPLIVIDGVAYTNLTINDLSPDDIESMDVLKGATASALYGYRGGNGVVMITTKSGKGEKGSLRVNISNNTMFNAGYLKIPKSQSSYSSGNYGTMEYGSGYVWGAYMDGREVEHYDPISKGLKVYPLLPRGKDNLDNFLESGFTANTNVNIAQSGELGSFRVSATQIHHKGQWPNTKINKYIFNVGGTINYKKLKIDASMGYKREVSPNMPKVNYGGGNYLYNMLIWTGKEIDVLQYKDYWKVKDQVQNWPWDGWYDNPYFLAHERIEKQTNNLLNAQATVTYDLLSNVKIILRSGIDNYSNRTEEKQAMGFSGAKKGFYRIQEQTGWSSNSDFLINANQAIGQFKFDLLGGAGLNYDEAQDFWGRTKDGLSVPAFYSLKASNEPAEVQKTYDNKVIYSLYSKLSVSWRDAVYVDLTARNDWSSTLSKDQRSYFYPSVGLSVLPTSFYNPIPQVMDYWKVRGSWTVSKVMAKVFEINRVFSLENNAWDGKTTASFPTKDRNPEINTETHRSFEIGTDFRFFKNRLGFDYTFFSRYMDNRIVDGRFSKASGLKEMYTNTLEDHLQQGMEFTLNATPIKNNVFSWSSMVNVSFWKTRRVELDPIYSSEDPRMGKNSRIDLFFTEEWERDLQGNIVHQGGKPVKNAYQSIVGHKDPDLIAGFLNTFTYKNFSLVVSVDGVFGGRMFSWTEQAMWHSGAHPDSDNNWRYDEVVNKKANYVGNGVKLVSGKLVTDKYGAVISDDRVFAPNDVQTSYQEYITDYNENPWDHAAPHNIINPTFIKLRELSLNYNLPASLVSKLGINTLQVGIVGQNLWMWAKESPYADPDRRSNGNENLNSPSQRFLGFNINLSF